MEAFRAAESSAGRAEPAWHKFEMGSPKGGALWGVARVVCGALWKYRRLRGSLYLWDQDRSVLSRADGLPGKRRLAGQIRSAVEIYSSKG